MVTSKSDSVTVSHIERIAVIDGSVGFTLDTFQVNPGLQATFPWLSAIAKRYETYQFNSLQFIYKTKTSTATTGDVTLAPDYDPIDAAPASTQEMESYKDARNTSPWQDITMTCTPSCLHKMKSYYVRTGSVPPGGTLLNYDPCNFYVATEGQPGVSLVGYLYAKYDITFHTPQFQNVTDALIGATVKSTVGAGATPANCLIGGTFAGTAGGVLIGAVTGALTFQAPGTYLISLNTLVTGNISAVVLTGLNLTAVKLSENGVGSATTTTVWSIVSAVPNAQITSIALTAGTQITNIELNVAAALAGSLVA
jgi:hypothetical protein